MSPLLTVRKALLAKARAVERGLSHPLYWQSFHEERSLTIPQAFGGSLQFPGKAVMRA
jgi:hypothetical protein